MSPLAQLRALNADQRNAFLAAFLGWALDAFDYFLMVFVLKDIATEFHSTVPAVSVAVTLTLAMRPLGAFIFGLAADRFGRRTPLMVNVIFYSIMELASGFAPNLTTFFVLRALFGIAMGGEWGVGAALAMETVPVQSRSMLSGILQEGYPFGYLLAALVYPLVAPTLGWRWMFFIGVLPALLSLFIRAKVKESPVWERRKLDEVKVDAPKQDLITAVRGHWPIFVYMTLLMTAFNFMSHGTQDLYPTFLREQRHFSPETIRGIAVTYNIGAILGGVLFGIMSEKIGRRRSIITAALLGLPMIPLWAFAPSAVLLALGGFLMQFMVQGAWGVIPAHLSELSPNAVRGTFTGFAYQVGNLIAAINLPLQTTLATKQFEGSYSIAMSIVVAAALLCVVLATALGKEAKGVAFVPEH